MSDDTLLTISVMGIVQYSARGLKQSLAPIAAAKVQRRTINGELVDLAVTKFQKYSTVITCSDQSVPAIDGIWPGTPVAVGCACELSYLTLGGSPSRPVVAGSSRVDGLYTFYRPAMNFLMGDIKIEFDEWGAEYGWSLTMDEV